MRLTPAIGAAAFSLAIPAVGLAQSTQPAAPGQVNPPASAAPAATSPGAPGAPGAMPPSSAPAPSTTSAGASTPTTIAAGLPVKDKNGASIGQVASVKTDASGKQTATIKMGADSFAVDTAALAVDNGAATINATQDEIRAMMKKGRK